MTRGPTLVRNVNLVSRKVAFALTPRFSQCRACLPDDGRLLDRDRVVVAGDVEAQAGAGLLQCGLGLA